MAISTQRIKLDVSKQPTPQQVVRLGQGNANATQLVVDVYDGGTAYSLTNYNVQLSIHLPNNGGYYQVNGTRSGNTATFSIDERYAAATYGTDGFGYIDILSGSTVICSTSRFQLVVLRNAADGVALSEQYINDVEEAVNRANEAAAAAEGIVLQDVPTMSANIKGGAKLGSGLSVSNNTLSVNASTIASGTLPIARGGTGAATAEAARNSLGVVTCYNQSDMSAEIGSTLAANQIWAVIASCINTANTDFNGHRCFLVVNNDGVSLYDSTASATKWALGGLTTVNSTVSQIATAASGITISSARYAVCGKVAQLTIYASGFSTTTGAKTLGTVVTGKRPATEIFGASNTTRTMYQKVGNDGVVTVYFVTAPGATTDTFAFSFTYLLP